MTLSVSIGACAQQIVPGSNELQLFPAGQFRAVDGRPEDAAYWVVDAAIAAKLIAAVAAKKTPFVIDYEHQTLNSKHNGQPAPAAGRFERIEWREGDGLYAVDIAWTAKAKAMIEAREYLYSSPVFAYDPKTGHITQLINAALTNQPGLDGMAEVKAAATLLITPTHEEPMNEQTKLAILLALGLESGATNNAITEALTAFTDAKKTADEKVTALTEEVNTLKAARADDDQADGVDPAKFVPVAAVTELQQELAALKASVTGDQVDTLVSAALANGQLPKSLESWARQLGITQGDYLKTMQASVAAVLAPRRNVPFVQF